MDELIQRVVVNAPMPGLQRFCDQVRDRLNSLILNQSLTRTPDGFAIGLALASPSGLEFTSGALRIDLDTTILSLASSGLQFATQSKNRVLAGPSSGSDAVPTFRTVVAADLGSGTADSTTFLAGDLQWRTVTGGVGSGDFVFNEVPSGTIDGSNTDFTLAHTPVSGTVRVYLNGLRQKPTDDYTISSDTISFVDAPFVDDTILVDYHK